MHKFVASFLILTVLALSPLPSLAAADVAVLKKDGLEAYFIEEHSLPIVTFEIIFPDGGYAYDPEDKIGLASLSAALLTEGAGDSDRDSFKNRLESTGSILSADVSADNLSFRVKTLKKNLNESFDLAMQALLQPRFEQHFIDVTKDQMRLALLKEKESVSDIGYRKWMELAFQKHPYARHAYGTPESLTNISRDDLKDYIKQHIHKDQIVVSIAGDLSPAEARALLGNIGSALPRSPAAASSLAAWKDFPEEEHVFIQKPGVKQNVILFGLPWVNHKDPDFYPAYLLNFILGGSSFDSRLNKEIREKRGLVYSVDSDVYAYSKSAFLLGSAAMRKGTENEVEQLVVDEIKNLHIMGISEEELAFAKKYVTGSFALMLDSSDKLVSYLSFMQMKKLGPDFIKRRNSLIENVTLADVNRVADKLLSLKRMIIVIAGERAQDQQKAGKP